MYERLHLLIINSRLILRDSVKAHGERGLGAVQNTYQFLSQLRAVDLIHIELSLFIALVCGGHRSLHPLCSTRLSLVSLDGPNLNIMTEFTITFDLSSYF